MGTGSGIVGISLALEYPAARVATVDISFEAISIARNNAGRLGAQIEFRQSDWFTALAGETYDLIVSNPPYVAEGDPHLELNGLPFEPRMALTDGADGLDCIRKIIAGAAAHLTPGGWLLFEHGYDQGESSRNLLTAAGFKAAFTHPDLAGTDRVSGAYL
jgi:release factor glutamine methyltransferase